MSLAIMRAGLTAGDWVNHSYGGIALAVTTFLMNSGVLVPYQVLARCVWSVGCAGTRIRRRNWLRDAVLLA
jgi:hypothetical protein